MLCIVDEFKIKVFNNNNAKTIEKQASIRTISLTKIEGELVTTLEVHLEAQASQGSLDNLLSH